MTALKPIENRRVRAVASERYPLNKKCSHPECNEPAVDPHHIFPRSEIGGSSWFVEITHGHGGGVLPDEGTTTTVIPHVTGLCRHHHDAVEGNLEAGHSAWIKLEDGVFVWYDRTDADDHDEFFAPLAPLNPQPGSVEGKPKRRRFKGEARRIRKTISLRVPNDAGEDGAALLDEQVEALEEKINPDADKRRPIYYTIIDALGYANLNADASDFGGDE